LRTGLKDDKGMIDVIALKNAKIKNVNVRRQGKI